MIEVSKELRKALEITSGRIIEDMLAEDAMDAVTVASITPEHFYKFIPEKDDRIKLYAEIDRLNATYGVEAVEKELAKYVCTYY